MPFGAHETMETHEILMEKINAITHFNLYAQQAQNPQLREMIYRHQQEEILSYNELVGLTRGSNRFEPFPSNTPIQGVNNQQIQYGVNNPPQMGPQADATLTDAEIAVAMLLCHKNGARNCTWASLECADPNLRRTLFNCAATCNNQAYEVFLLMNQQGLYQVPTLSPQGQRFLGSYQPAGAALQAQYGLTNGQMAGNTGAYPYGAAGYSNANMGGTGGNLPNQNFSAGTRESVLYGAGTGVSPYQYQAGGPAVNSTMIGQGRMGQ